LINITKINDDQDKTTKTMFHEITEKLAETVVGITKKDWRER